MSLENKLIDLIEVEALKLSDRQHAYHNALHLEHERKTKRLTAPGAKEVKTPSYWIKDKKFNPFYVQKNKKQIAYSIAKKIMAGTYTPNEPILKQIPKPSGGNRSVTIYQIPDAAVSRMIYEQLIRKNKHRFSSFSYAYRNDRNVHFAIQDIGIELTQNSRIYVAEFDFSKFFDSIDHVYLFSQFDKNGFLISAHENQVIRSFLGTSGKGIPQGTSISLFLANLVCWRLDRELEQAGLRFARYADDTIIWSKDYDKISKASQIISNFSFDAGIAINSEKSKGIRLLCKQTMKVEMESTPAIEFLGYSISTDNISIKATSENKIKRQINYILYKHLIQPLRGAKLAALTIPANNKDENLVSAVMEIRRYLYGDLTDQMIANYISGVSNRIFFKGVMSFYPLINNETQLKDLDGWLITAIYKAINLRGKLLKAWGHNRDHNFPFNVTRNNILTEFRRQKIHGKKLLNPPSFYFVYQALKKGLLDFGVEGVMNPASNTYNYYG
ncbi:reverse transcriptase domain-containing protein [Pseudomonas viridiflava]|uniref:reverse transcriptase domain-containing protein n=1 Tax=Pseudomonas viridiflava TaxID=33069 RepID=UPI000F0539D6|nr:reverse transcriptase domain-containing protein [Pseudomonas viridiflava]